VGVCGVGHHDFFNIFREWSDFDFDEVMRDPEVIGVVQEIQSATTQALRIKAVNRLMEKVE
jgi:hypothetical protein